MERVPKDHNISFLQHLSICDLTFGPQFFKHIQFHYDMNLDSKMFIEKLQMLASAQVTNEQKVSRNQSNVLKEAKKFPKQGFLDGTFDKWLHKTTFWFQVNPLLISTSKFLFKLKEFLNNIPFFIWRWRHKNYFLLLSLILGFNALANSLQVYSRVEIGSFGDILFWRSRAQRCNSKE